MKRNKHAPSLEPNCAMTSLPRNLELHLFQFPMAPTCIDLSFRRSRSMLCIWMVIVELAVEGETVAEPSLNGRLDIPLLGEATMTLLDDEDIPISGAQFVVLNGAKEVQRGVLDEAGSAFLTGLPPNSAVVFPELDPTELRPIPIEDVPPELLDPGNGTDKARSLPQLSAMFEFAVRLQAHRVGSIQEAWERAAKAAGKGGKVIRVGHGVGNDSGGADFFLRLAASEKKARKPEFGDTVARKSRKWKLDNGDLIAVINHEKQGNELFGRAISFAATFKIAREALTANQVKEAGRKNAIRKKPKALK